MLCYKFSPLKMTTWGQLAFQDAASPVISQIIAFHDHAALVIILVVSFIGYILILLITRPYTCRKVLEANTLEIVWTIVPALILAFLAVPSLRLLYLIDEISAPKTRFKIIGHQWYWSYEYRDLFHINFDSYIVRTEDLELGDFRLLEVDHRAVIPIRQEIRILVTSADVIHSVALPALGIKLDAIPGRLNQVGLTTTCPGVFYGQCSEICGVNHSFIPISIEAVKTNIWVLWLTKFGRHQKIFEVKPDTTNPVNISLFRWLVQYPWTLLEWANITLSLSPKK